MARYSNPKSAYALINAVYRQATGEASLTAVDTSSFIAMGESLFAGGKENVMNAISYVVGSTKIDIRSYKGKLSQITMSGDVFDTVTRKISFFTRDALDTTMFNTGASASGGNGNPISDGAQPTFATLRLSMPLEEYYTGHSTWMTKITRTSEQLKEAFRSEADFMAFMGGIMVEVGNEIALQKEAFRRSALLNYMGEGIDKESANGTAVNLTSAYNTAMGLTGQNAKTTAQLLSTEKKNFYKFFMQYIDMLSEEFTQLDKLHHDAKTKTVSGTSYSILRDCPVENQRLILNAKVKREIEYWVRPDTFHDGIFNLDGKCELLEFWQSETSKDAINVTVAEVTNGAITATTSAVNKAQVLGILYDVDGLGVQERFEKSDIEHNASMQVDTYLYFFDQNIVNDVTKKHVVFYMEDPSQG